MSPYYIDDLCLPTRTRNALVRAGVDIIHKLMQLSRRDLMALPEMGRKGVLSVEDELNKCGLSLSRKDHGWSYENGFRFEADEPLVVPTADRAFIQGDYT